MSKKCDNTSVGVLIYNNKGEILLIERKKYPYGFAAPAGHIDDFSSPEACARGEVLEEVGLHVTALTKKYEKRHENPCRRIGGTFHQWHIFEASVTGDVVGSADETRQTTWADKAALMKLANYTKSYNAGDIDDKQWELSPGLEPIWLTLFTEVGVLN